MGDAKNCIKVRSKNFKGRHHLTGTGVAWKIIPKLNLDKQHVKQTGSNRLRINF
jgi:hypothetical protein